MNEQKFSDAVTALTNTIADNKPAADALQLLITDYLNAQALIVSLSEKLENVTQAPTIATQIINDSRTERIQKLNDLAETQSQHEPIIRNLSDAQANIQVAKIKNEEYLKTYQQLAAGTAEFKENITGLANATLTTFLGPAATVGNIKAVADILFT